MAPTALAVDAATLYKWKSGSAARTTAAPAPSAGVTVAVSAQQQHQSSSSPKQQKQQPKPPPTYAASLLKRSAAFTTAAPAAGGNVAVASAIQQSSAPKQQPAALPNRAPTPPRPGQMRGNPYYKEVAVNAGRLGIALQFMEEGGGSSGAIIQQISPSCSFKDNIQIGDRIVNINGRPLTKRDDLNWKKDSLRIFGIIPFISPAMAATMARESGQIRTNNVPAVPAQPAMRIQTNGPPVTATVAAPPMTPHAYYYGSALSVQPAMRMQIHRTPETMKATETAAAGQPTKRIQSNGAQTLEEKSNVSTTLIAAAATAATATAAPKPIGRFVHADPPQPAMNIQHEVGTNVGSIDAKSIAEAADAYLRSRALPGTYYGSAPPAQAVTRIRTKPAQVKAPAAEKERENAATPKIKTNVPARSGQPIKRMQTDGPQSLEEKSNVPTSLIALAASPKPIGRFVHTEPPQPAMKMLNEFESSLGSINAKSIADAADEYLRSRALPGTYGPASPVQPMARIRPNKTKAKAPTAEKETETAATPAKKTTIPACPDQPAKMIQANGAQPTTLEEKAQVSTPATTTNAPAVPTQSATRMEINGASTKIGAPPMAASAPKPKEKRFDASPPQPAMLPLPKEKRFDASPPQPAMKTQNEAAANVGSINAKSIAEAADAYLRSRAFPGTNLETSALSYGKRQREATGNSIEEAAPKQAKTVHDSDHQHMKFVYPPSVSAQQYPMQFFYPQPDVGQQHNPPVSPSVVQKHARLAAQNNDRRLKREFDSWHNGWKKHMKATTLYYRKRHADGWEQRLKELIHYKVHNLEGDWHNVPLDYRDPDDLTLGEWVRKQRELYWEGKLDLERVMILQGHGFDFDYEPPPEASFSGDKHWDNKLKELIEYKKEHLNTDVPISYPEDSETLGKWVHKQRELYNEGTLARDKHIILEEKGFIFEPGTNVEKTVIHEGWRKNLTELAQFKRDHGHLEVPFQYKATSLSSELGRWVGAQRADYKRKKLPRNKIKLLEEIGLDLSARKKKTGGNKSIENWENVYTQLVAFREKNGHVNVPQSLGKLGLWCKTQRLNFRKGKLLDYRTRQLQMIGFNFNSTNKQLGLGEEQVVTTQPPLIDPIFHSQAWVDNYDALKSFITKFGCADVPPDTEGSLYTWLETQKSFFAENKLPPKQVDMFISLGVDLSEKSNFTVDRHEFAWLKRFEALKEFLKQNGTDDDVPVGNLNRWIIKQRADYKNNKLSEDRIQKLESIGIDLNGKKQIDWKKKRRKAIIGDFPDDLNWFEHKDGVRRRVPSEYMLPTEVSLEQIYILYHCQTLLNGDGEKMISPIKSFEPNDLTNDKKDRGHKAKGQLREIKRICSIIDQSCLDQGVVINGIMTPEDARRCVRVGYKGLQLPPRNDGRNIIHVRWSEVGSESPMIDLRFT